MSGALALIPMALALQAGEVPPEPVEPETQTQSERPPGGLGTQVEPAEPLDPGIIEGRRRPGFNAELPDAVTQDNPGAVRAPPPQAFPADQIPIPDRWRLIESLGLVTEKWYDPYHQNTYKGDRPICIPSEEVQERRRKAREDAAARGEPAPYGSAHCRTPKFLGLKAEDEWFFVANLISDSVFEPRTFPIPVGVQTTEDADRLDVFGNTFSPVFSQTFIAGFALIKGSTAYKPPDVEYRLTLAYNINHVDVPERRVLLVEPSAPSHRTDHFLGVQEAFFDYHIRNTSKRYDFDRVLSGAMMDSHHSGMSAYGKP